MSPLSRTASRSLMAVAGAVSLLAAGPVLAADAVKVGLLSTLSGPGAGIGIDVRDAFQLAVKLNGGKLGMVQKGLLYPELDAVLFEMKAGQLSDVIESPVGLHLLFCEAVHPARRVPLEEALPQLREKLTNRKRKAHQRQWLAALLSQPAKMESQAHG